MLPTREIRRRNLLALTKEAGRKRSAFSDKPKAEELKISYNYVNQLINGTRGIGDKAARKLEDIGEKPIYWLDHPHPELWEMSVIDLLNDGLLNSGLHQEQYVEELAQQSNLERREIERLFDGAKYDPNALPIKKLTAALKIREATLQNLNEPSIDYTTELPSEAIAIAMRFMKLSKESQQKIDDYLTLIETASI